MWLTSLSPWEAMTSCKPGKGKQENSLAHLFPKACCLACWDLVLQKMSVKLNGP